MSNSDNHVAIPLPIYWQGSVNIRMPRYGRASRVPRLSASKFEFDTSYEKVRDGSNTDRYDFDNL